MTFTLTLTGVLPRVEFHTYFFKVAPEVIGSCDARVIGGPKELAAGWKTAGGAAGATALPFAAGAAVVVVPVAGVPGGAIVPVVGAPAGAVVPVVDLPACVVAPVACAPAWAVLPVAGAPVCAAAALGAAPEVPPCVASCTVDCVADCASCGAPDWVAVDADADVCAVVVAAAYTGPAGRSATVPVIPIIVAKATCSIFIVALMLG
jgi:hypothetical protein